jgi:hypothetical protein
MAGQDSPPPTNDPLNLATLHLCSASYATDIVRIPGLVLETCPLASGGIWRCLWGPSQSSDEANLAFVAGYAPQPGLPVQSICVTIRGTDIDVDDIWGILAQVWEDIDGTSQVSVPWKGWKSSAAIARGTSEGLRVIMGLTEQGVSLGEFLTRFLGAASNSGVKTLVTGHSLGACLATVVAPWIDSMRPASYKGEIQPITFAGPTAGNNDFADEYSTKFTSARRFQNTLDIIPLALDNLIKVLGIYLPNFLITPDLVWMLVLGMLGALQYEGVTYQQPVQNASQGQQMLTGNFYSQDGDDWYTQALHQHHPATYLSLLKGTQLDASALPRSALRGGREARLAKLIDSAERASGLVDEAVARLRRLAAARV